MAHSHSHHREHQVAHRRVHKILEEHGHEAKHHHSGPHAHAFSKVTSKSAAEKHDGKFHGHKGAKRYAKGGRVKGHKGNTNIAIVIPHHAPGSPSAVAPTGGAGAGGPPVMAGGPPPMPPPGAGGPPGMGMPMRARGGGVHIDGGATKENLSKWAARASANSYAAGGKIKGGQPTAGSFSGVGRLQLAGIQKRQRKGE